MGRHPKKIIKKDRRESDTGRRERESMGEKCQGSRVKWEHGGGGVDFKGQGTTELLLVCAANNNNPLPPKGKGGRTSNSKT